MGEYQIQTNEYHLIVIRDDFPWGNGVRAKIYNCENNFLGEVRLACHPEFEGYELFQNFSTAELVNEAVKIISERMAVNAFDDSWKNNLTPLLRLNMPAKV